MSGLPNTLKEKKTSSGKKVTTKFRESDEYFPRLFPSLRFFFYVKCYVIVLKSKYKSLSIYSESQKKVTNKILFRRGEMFLKLTNIFHRRSFPL